MSRNSESKFQVHLSSTKAMFQYMTQGHKGTREPPSAPLDPKALKRSRRLKLADPKFYQPGPIDILIGNDVYERLMMAGKIEETEELFHRESAFAWVVTGKYVISSAHPGEAVAKFYSQMSTISSENSGKSKKFHMLPYLQRKKKSVKGTSLTLLHIKRMAGM